MSLPGGRPLRIVHVITTLELGGAEVMLTKLLEHTELRRYPTLVVALAGRGALAARLESRGVEVLALGASPGIAAVSGLVRLARIFRARRPDVVLTWLYDADLLGFLATRLAAVPALAWNVRCAELDPRDHPWRLRAMLALLARLSGRVAAVVVNSEAGRDASLRLGYHPPAWVSIPNGFDVSRFAPQSDARDEVRAELGLLREALLVGLVARYHPMKDHETFLEAAARLRTTHPAVHFVLLGRDVDPANRMLAAIVDRLGLRPVVHLLGERDDVPRLTASLDVATCSSYSEGFPNAVGEAMASGVPCVSTEVGDCRTVVGETGVIVPPRDPGALADGWRQLLDLAPEARRALGRAARARVTDRFEIGAVARAYEALYDRLGRASPGP
jgi:glycosyltransferase involved in cell wall biosynthesis